VASFVHVLCQSRLLDHHQCDKLTRKLQYRFADPQMLADDLVRRGWLTPEQVQGMLSGQAAVAAPSRYAERRAASQRRWLIFNIVGAIVILALGSVAIYVIKHDKLGARDKAESARLAALETHASFDASTRDDAGLRKQLLAFRNRYAEVPSAMKAAEMLAALPSPLDGLSKANIRREEQEKGQPENLVAVLGQRRWRHWGAIRAVAITANGATVASAGDDGQVRLWDRTSGTETAALPAGNVVALTFLPGDKMLAWHTADGNVRLWNLEKSDKHGDYPGPVKKVTAAVLTRDALVAASAEEGGAVKVWELETGREIGTLRGHKEAVNAVAFAPDGDTVATASADGSVILWGPSGNARVQLAEHTDGVTSVAFSKDGKYLASGGGGRDCNVIIWDVAKGESLQLLEGHGGPVQALAFTPDMKHIVSAGGDGTVRMSELRLVKPAVKPLVPPMPPPNPNNENQNNENQNPNNENPANPPMPPPPARLPPPSSYKFLGHAGPVLAVALHGEGDNQTIISAGGDCTVRLWSVARRGDMSGVREHQGPIVSLVFMDDQQLLSGSHDKTARVWDASGTMSRMLLAGHGAAVSSVSYSPVQKLIASGSYDGTIRLWDPTMSKELAVLAPHMGPVIAVALAPDGKSLAAGATSASFQGGELKIWDPATHKERGSLPAHQDVVQSVAFAPDGRTFASGSFDGTVRLWEPWTGIQRGVLADKAAIECVAFAPDNKSLAVSTHARVVKIWDATRKEEKRTLTGLTALCKSLAFSPDGTLLAGTQPDGRVIVWNLVSGEARAWNLPDPVHAVAFAPDSRHLATGNANGTIYILRLAEPPKRGKK
jgi:WD40 repeat protein